jgi:hypothetical protein
MPASTIIGTFASSIINERLKGFKIPKPVPIGAAPG